tara:strand:+ start:46 stop:366 length:321 start_codon:yes stop_codon:yes gene_type:complete
MAKTHLVVKRLKINNETKVYPLFEGSKPFARTYRQGWIDAYREITGRYPDLHRGGKVSIIDMQLIKEEKIKAHKAQTRLNSEPCNKCGATIGETCKHSRSKGKTDG